MTMNVVNFARHATTQQLRWFVGEQFPLWVQELLARKAAGKDVGKAVEELAALCHITADTKLLEANPFTRGGER